MEIVTSALDKKTMIHIASELIIVGGITFWLNGKINGQVDSIAQLKKENAELKARLDRIEQFLSQATGGPPGPSGVSRPERHRNEPRPPEAAPGTESEEEEILDSDDEEIEI